MKKFWVYIHTCPNGKKYVGITTRIKPEIRWGRNGEGYKGQLFGKAVSKYGWSNITHEAWELTCESEMYYAEKYLIAYYHTTESEFGYNNSSGGECIHLGCKYSEESKKKMSEAQKKVHSDPEYRKRISETLKKRCSDPEVQKKLSELWKERWADPEYRKRLSEAHKGKSRKPFSESHRKHISENGKERWADPEYRRKQVEARKGKPKPRVKIQLPDGTIIETTKNLIVRNYVNKGKKFEYVP